MHFPRFSPRFARCLSLLGAAASLALPVQAAGPARPSVVGRVSAGETVPVVLTLPLRDAAGLDALLTHLYSPGDPAYHRFITPDEFAAKFGPTQADYDAAARWARAQGLTVTATHRSRLLLEVSGPASATEAAFGVQLEQVKVPAAGGRAARLARQPDTAPRVPAALAGRVSGVVGLDTVPVRRPHLRQASLTAAAGTGVGGGLSVSDIRAAYGFSSFSGTGAGQTIAIFQLATFAQSDITAYQNANGLPRVPVNTVQVSTGVSAAFNTPDDQAEATLDAEMALALTPNLSSVQVYLCPNTDAGVLAGYSRIANDNTAAQVSTSWGLAETKLSRATLNSEYTIFKQMAAQGQALLASAGDNGAYDTGIRADGLTVDDPASQPYVTGVGGTTLRTQSPGGPYLSETTWYNSATSAGGGGVSTQWGVPAYQQSVPGVLNGRTVPDISFNADPNTGYAIYVGGGWTNFGGTSPATPLWAGLTALVNSRRAAQGLGRVGFLNPAIYQIGQANVPANFHDIADGSSNGFYTAASGYDPATGWGTPTETLLNSLAAYGQPALHPQGATTAHVAWINTTGQLSLWSLNASDSFNYANYGPFDGWSLTAMADDKTGKTRILWNNISGQMSLWNLDTATGAYTHAEYGPYPSYAATALAIGSDNHPRILWNRTDGKLSLWNVDGTGSFTYNDYGPYASYKAAGLAIGSDNHPRILWNRTDGKLSLWNVDGTGSFGYNDYGPYASYTATAIAVGTDNHPRIFWNRTDGKLSLWNVDGTGSFGYNDYGPYPSYTAAGIAIGSDNHPRILWDRTDGKLSLWNVGPSGSFTYSDFGPYPGWTAKAISAP